MTRPEDSDAAAALSWDGERGRKVLHLLALVIPLFVMRPGRAFALPILIPLALAALLGDVVRAHSPGFNRWIGTVFGFMMRTHELPAVRTGIVLNGATWVLTSAALLSLLFPATPAAAGMTLFLVGDAMAALVGRRYGRHRVAGGPATYEGALAFCGSGMLVAAFFPGLPFPAAAVAVVVGAALEALPLPLNDNLRVPFGIAGVLYLIPLLPGEAGATVTL